jgi:hypothetical protein
MPTIQFPTEFSELLRLLNEHDVKYLVVGGYAVAHHGYPRTTGDLDLWVERAEDNATRIVTAVREFGFDVPALDPSLFVGEDPNRTDGATTPPSRDPHDRERRGVSGVL